MENVQDKSGCYNVEIKGTGRENTSTYKELCIYPDREFILYGCYWSMAYTYAIDPSDDKFIFPNFAKTLFNIGKSIIDSKVTHMFRKVYGSFYGIFQQY